MARAAAKFPQNATVYTTKKISGPLEIRHGTFNGAENTVPNADYPTQYALNEHMAEMWAKHERKYRKRFSTAERVETQFYIMDRNPEREEERGLFFVLTTNFHEPE